MSQAITQTDVNFAPEIEQARLSAQAEAADYQRQAQSFIQGSGGRARRLEGNGADPLTFSGGAA